MGIERLHEFFEKLGLFKKGTLSDALKSFPSKVVSTDVPSVFLPSFYSDLVSFRSFIFQKRFNFENGLRSMRSLDKLITEEDCTHSLVLDGKLDENHLKAATTQGRHSGRGGERMREAIRGDLLLFDKPNGN